MTFNDIKGHEATRALLQGYLRQGRMNASFLFAGPEGIGKFLTARVVAAAVNCETGGADACGECPACVKIEKLQHPDVHIIEATSEGDDAPDNASQVIKIDQIRELKRQASLRAYEAREKVFIINDAHRMNPEAANCLLKTLEEPSTDTLIMLVTAKPNLLFKTVISRCQTVKFYPFKAGMLEGILAGDYGMSTTEAHFLAIFSEGSLGRALGARDSSVIRDKNRIIDELALHTGGLRSPWPVENRFVLRQQLNILATWFRDIYVCKAGLAASEFMHQDRTSEITAASTVYSWVALEETMKFISDAISYTEQNVNPKLIVSNIRAAL